MIEIGKDIDYAVNKLKDGGIVGIPTETVYGLGCNALNESSVKKILLILDQKSVLGLNIIKS